MTTSIVQQLMAAAANGAARPVLGPQASLIRGIPSGGPQTGRATSTAARRRKRKISRRLATTADILDAAHWRLRAWPPERITTGVALVAGMVGRGEALGEDEPVVGEALASLADHRDPWTALGALLVLHAEAVGDVALFFAAGFEVLNARRQAQRASGRRGGDALDAMIRDYLQEMPDISPATLWRDFSDQAADGWGDVFADFDEGTGCLRFEPHAGATLVTINFEAFRKRVQTVRKNLSRGVRYEPAALAPDEENAHQGPLRVAVAT